MPKTIEQYSNNEVFMNFKAIESADGKVLIISTPPRLTTENSDGLKKLLKNYVDEGRYNIVINLTGTDYLDSSGLGAIVSKIAQTRSNNGDIRLASVNEYVMNLLELTHINQIIKIFDTPEQAAASFGG
jgi:anti-sigma B factor antagonist